MKRFRWLLVAVLALALTGVGPAPRASADESSLCESTPTSTASDEELERWWGVLGAALCGTEIRLVHVAPVVGMNPYVLAAGIAGCLLALLDATT